MMSHFKWNGVEYHCEHCHEAIRKGLFPTDAFDVVWPRGYIAVEGEDDVKDFFCCCAQRAIWEQLRLPPQKRSEGEILRFADPYPPLWTQRLATIPLERPPWWRVFRRNDWNRVMRAMRKEYERVMQLALEQEAELCKRSKVPW